MLKICYLNSNKFQHLFTKICTYLEYGVLYVKNGLKSVEKRHGNKKIKRRRSKKEEGWRSRGWVVFGRKLNNTIWMGYRADETKRKGGFDFISMAAERSKAAGCDIDLHSMGRENPSIDVCCHFGTYKKCTPHIHISKPMQCNARKCLTNFYVFPMFWNFYFLKIKWTISNYEGILFWIQKIIEISSR